MVCKHSLLFLAVFFVFAVSVSAEITMVSPVSAVLENTSSFSIGSAMPGETIELVFSNDAGNNDYWNRLEIVNNSLPENWKATPPELFAESLVLSIQIPKEEHEKMQTIRIRLSDARDNTIFQEASLKLLVKNDLLKTSFSPLQDSVSLGEQAFYKVVLVNNSIAPHTVIISSSLPGFWFKPQTVFLPAKQDAEPVKELTLSITPKAYGLRNFSFFIDSGLSYKRITGFQGELLVKPTLEGKFQSGLFGFSFFSPNLSVFYFFNALLGSLQ